MKCDSTICLIFHFEFFLLLEEWEGGQKPRRRGKDREFWGCLKDSLLEGVSESESNFCLPISPCQPFISLLFPFLSSSLITY